MGGITQSSNGSLTHEQQLKLAFAEAWLRNPKNAFAAALTVTRGNTFIALELAQNWLFDDEVIAFKEQLIEERGEEAFLPSKAEMVREVWDRAVDAECNDEFAKLARLASDMRGFIEKPGVTVNNNNINNNKVMLVPMPNLDDDGTIDAHSWEKMSVEQQKSITE